MDPLTYSATFLGYILGVKPLEEWQKRKVKVIEDLNIIQQRLGKGALTPEQFDYFWDAPLEEMLLITIDHSNLLLKQ